MRPYWLLFTGLLMTAIGGYLIFFMPDVLPLWLIWLVGPFFWYIGIAVSITGISISLFVSNTAEHKNEAAAAQKQNQNQSQNQNQKQELPVLRFSSLAFAKCGPAGVRSEIPAMGGFIL